MKEKYDTLHLMRRDFDLHANSVNAIMGTMRHEASRTDNYFYLGVVKCLHHITAMMISLEIRIKKLEGGNDETNSTT